MPGNADDHDADDHDADDHNHDHDHDHDIAAVVAARTVASSTNRRIGRHAAREDQNDCEKRSPSGCYSARNMIREAD